MSAPIQLNAGPRFFLISCIPQFSPLLLFVMTWLSQGSFHLNTPSTEEEWSFFIYFFFASTGCDEKMSSGNFKRCTPDILCFAARTPDRSSPLNKGSLVATMRVSPSETELLVHHAQIDSNQKKITGSHCKPGSF